MSKEFKFFIYMLERYAARNGETADITLNRLAEHGLYDYAVKMYDLYHVENLENAFYDLDRKLNESGEKRRTREGTIVPRPEIPSGQTVSG
ncbi:MAG: DUF3791 domain-containing protein [Kiritimatiellae bacterium]|nr:DUF3791 domain-containing protein [Kiritimatiellia bacterium]